MNIRQRTKILSRIPLEELTQWDEQIKELGAVKIIKAPHMGLVMTRARDTAEQQVFNLGEVLVSECTVTVDDQQGYGVAMGNQLQRAEIMAILDAIFHTMEAKWQALQVDIIHWLKEQEYLQQKEQQREFNLISRSKVKFDMMEEMVGDEVDGEL